MASDTSFKIPSEHHQECVNWALTQPIYVDHDKFKTKREYTNVNRMKEKEWGLSIVKKIPNIKKDTTQWTTSLGEGLVHDILVMRGENPRRPKKIDVFHIPRIVTGKQ